MTTGRKVSLHPSAVEEARAAYGYYSTRSERAGTAFLAELDRAIIGIAESPSRWRSHLHGTRRYIMRRFPFLVIYHEVGAALEVVAVAHARRRPGYWRGRV